MRNKKYILFVFLAIIPAALKAQKVFSINDFSDKYILLYAAADTADLQKGEYFLLYNKMNNTLALECGDEKLKPFIEQHKTSAVRASHNKVGRNIYWTNDVNFDGRKDIEIDLPGTEGQGCYDDNLREIKIFISKGEQFVECEPLAKLINETYCTKGGSVEFRNDTKTIHAFTNGGYAYHVSATYVWKNDTIKEIEEITDDGTQHPFGKITGKKWKNNQWEKIDEKYLNTNEETKALLSFDTQNGKGRPFLFIENDMLYYAFMKADSVITFAYPSQWEKAEISPFYFSSDNNESEYRLTFRSDGETAYTIYESQNKIGIKIKINDEEYDWAGVLSSKNGSLNILKNRKCNNLFIE